MSGGATASETPDRLHPEQLPPEQLPGDMRGFLQELGLLRPGDSLPPARPLTGGVSSDIWLIAFPGRPICIKRALPALKVKADWRAPVERSRYEYAWLREAAAVLPDAVPALVGQSRDASMFASAYLDAPLWKARLLSGEVAIPFAAAVGDALGRIHAATASDARVAQSFPTDSFFHALRLEPYLLATAERRPEVAAQLRALAATTAENRRALVHGDISPKNILIGPGGPVFLDAECAWYGDPAFDLAFCLNHLLLKRIVIPARTPQLWEAFRTLSRAYLAHVAWEAPAALERRCAALLPGLFLARVDGKSPVEYITRDRERDAVRRVAIPLLQSPVESLEAVARRWYD